MTQSMVIVAQQLNSSQSALLPDDKTRVRFAVRSLERWSHRWLLVFDNCDDASTFPELHEFIPYVGQGSILFTSRHRGLEELADVIEVAPMPCRTGVQLLLCRYRDVNIDDYFAEGAEVVDRLGNLALAIEQASAYMNYIRLPIDQLRTFLPKFLAQREKILQHTTPDFWSYSKIVDSAERETAISVFTTWELSFQRLLDSEPNRDHIAHFLILTAFFGRPPILECIFRFHWELSRPRPIWMSIFAIESKEEIKKEGSTIQAEITVGSYQAFGQRQLSDRTASWRSDRFWRLIRGAFRLLLLHDISYTDDIAGASLTLHPLIRDWLQLRLALGERQAYTREAISILSSSIQVCTTANSNAQIRLAILSHLNDVLINDKEFFGNKHRLGQEISTCDTADRIASFYRDQGQYDASIRLHNREVATKKAAMGAEHPSTLISINRLALALRLQGKYVKAEELYTEVLEVRKRVLGDEHPDTLTSISNVAIVLYYQGRYDKAEKMNRRALEVRQRVLVENHPDTLVNMNDLALVLCALGQYDEAEQLHRRELQVRRQSVGDEHSITLTSMNNLALVLRRQRKESEAEQLHRQVAGVRERVSGAEHPSTLISMSNLAVTLRHQGKYSEAEPICRRVLQARTRVLGDEHPDTFISVGNLALVLSSQGRHTEAEQMHRQELEMTRRVQGDKHPHTLASMNNLGKVLCDQGKYHEAEVIQLEAVQASFTNFGRQHPTSEEYLDCLRHICEREGGKERRVWRETFLEKWTSLG